MLLNEQFCCQFGGQKVKPQLKQGKIHLISGYMILLFQKDSTSIIYVWLYVQLYTDIKLNRIVINRLICSENNHSFRPVKVYRKHVVWRINGLSTFNLNSTEIIQVLMTLG